MTCRAKIGRCDYNSRQYKIDPGMIAEVAREIAEGLDSSGVE